MSDEVPDLLPASQRDSIDVTTFRHVIRRTLDSLGLRSCEVLLAPSVQDWAQSVGIDEPDPFRIAMATRARGGPAHVVLAEIITGDDQENVLSRLSLGVFTAELGRLDSPEAFLEHLVLHEAAHILLPAGASEDDCDRWAFERLSGSWRSDSASGAT